MNAKRFFLFFTLLIFLACGSSNDPSDTSGDNGNNSGGNNNGGNTGGNDDTKDETNYYFSDSGNDSNSGSQKNPWKSLSKLRIYFLSLIFLKVLSILSLIDSLFPNKMPGSTLP